MADENPAERDQEPHAEDATPPEGENPAAEIESIPGEAIPPKRELEGSLIEMQASLRRIEQLVTGGFEESGKRDRILDELHQENQKHRNKLLLSAMEPILRGLIRLHDDMLDTLQREKADTEERDREGFLRDLTCFSEEILEILSRQGVQPFEDDPGTPFDARRHQIMRVISLDEPDQDAKIIEVQRKGFAIHQEIENSRSECNTIQVRTIRPQLVVVGKYRPPAVSNSEHGKDTPKDTENPGGCSHGS